MRDISSDMRLLQEGLEELGLPLSAGQELQFAGYIREIYLFNSVYGLVSAVGREFIVKHLLDSLSAVFYFLDLVAGMPVGTRMCDVGSGAGLPGIPLAIMLSDVPISLIERSGRRTGFLRNALALCNLDHRVEVIERDLSEIDDSFGVVTFRAFHPLTDVIRPIGAILAEGGSVCAYKGRRDLIDEELAAVGSLVETGKGGSDLGWIHTIVPLKVPFLDASRNLCVLRKNEYVTRIGKA